MTAAPDRQRPPTLATIGYEAATQDAVIERLLAAQIELLVDVRAVAASRRAGFSKRALAAGLEAAGIAYLHLRALGTPKPGREAARKGRIAEMREIYETHLREDAAVAAFAELTAAVAQKRAALLCFEADASGCHRTILAERLAAAGSVADVEHLGCAAIGGKAAGGGA